ncbi:MAG: hypothetical protein ACRESS_06150 [Stenotrophobium sp.]
MKIMPLILGCAAALQAIPALAAGQGFALGYDYWNYRVSGIVEDNGTQLGLHRDLGVEPQNRDAFFLRWDTGPGWWRPDLTANYMHVLLTGNAPYTTSGLQLGSLNLLPGTTTVLTNVDIHDTELTFSYPFALGRLRNSAGVTAKYLKGYLELEDSSGNSTDYQRINDLFPMAHLDVNLPLGDFVNLIASGNWIGYHGEGAYEYSGGIDFRILGPLTLSARWQQKYYNVKDGYTLHANLRGMLFGAHLVFE